MIDTAADALGSASSGVMYLSQFGQLAVSGAMIFTDGYFWANSGPMYWPMKVVIVSPVHWALSQVAT